VKYELSVDPEPSKDLLGTTAGAEESKKKERDFAELKAKARPYIDLDKEILKAKLSDPCWHESKECIEKRIFSVKSGSNTLPEYDAPESLIPGPTK
jgi:hypothetical protein